jgi:protocatechuate 3,4-dioxygenase beta subunit
MTFLLMALALALAQPDGAPRAALEGRVVALGTNRPVAHASVVVARVNGSLEDYRTGATDVNGRFAFRDLTPGSYRVHVERQGYLSGEHGRRTAGGAGVPIVLTEREPTASIIVPLIQTAVIAGRVVDDGRPVRHVLVRALRSTYRDGERSLTMVAYASTDDLGRYRLFGLAPGTYAVAAAPPSGPRIEGDTYVVPVVPSNANNNLRERRTPLDQALRSGTVDASAFTMAMLLPVFYPGRTDEASAVAIELRAGDVVSDIDLPVVRVSTARVAGRVLTADGQPARGAQVNVQTGGNQELAAIPGVSVTANGGFELPFVPPGVHQLVSRTTTQYGTATVSVGTEDVGGVEIRLQPGTTVTGRVAVQDAPPGFPDRDSGVLTVQLLGRTLFTTSARVAADGSFSIPNVHPDDYRLRIRYGREIMPISARLGVNDIREMPVRLGAGTPGVPLEIVVTLATGALDATVVDARGRPVAGTVVALVPNAPFRYRSGLYRTAMTDQNGRASIDEVPPGEYTVMAGDVEPEDWQNPDRVRAYEGRGERVTIRAEGRHRVALETTTP